MNTLTDQINKVREELGMFYSSDFESMSAASKRQWLKRYNNLKRDFANDAKADNIMSMHASDIAALYVIDCQDALSFYVKIHTR